MEINGIFHGYRTTTLKMNKWNFLKNCPSQIYKHWKSDLDNSWESFMCEKPELSCWNFNGDFILPYCFPMDHDLFFWNKYWFGNRSLINLWYTLVYQVGKLKVRIYCESRVYSTNIPRALFQNLQNTFYKQTEHTNCILYQINVKRIHFYEFRCLE